eukprot:6183782-Pleurochrysis_carterae.AAC.1
MRMVAAGKAKRLIFAIGRIPGLTQEQMGRTVALGIAGVLGYYARSTPMDLTTCKSIEEARAKVLRAAGYSTGLPRGSDLPQNDGGRNGNSRTRIRGRGGGIL